MYNVRYNRSRVQHCVIMYNVRYTDHESKLYLTLYMMTQCWTRDLCIWHYTWWRNVGLVICVIWHYTWWTQCWTRDLYLTLYMMTQWLDSWTYVSDIIQNDVGTRESVHLTLYRMTPCWDSWSVASDIVTEWRHVGTRDLCIWHYTGWRNVGPRDLCNLKFLQNDANVGTNDLFI